MKKKRKDSDEKALQDLTDLLDKEPGKERKTRPLTTNLGELIASSMEKKKAQLDGHTDTPVTQTPVS
jgi:hypothetical protein